LCRGDGAAYGSSGPLLIAALPLAMTTPQLTASSNDFVRNSEVFLDRTHRSYIGSSDPPV
jgi:hypothetical protein